MTGGGWNGTNRAPLRALTSEAVAAIGGLVRPALRLLVDRDDEDVDVALQILGRERRLDEIAERSSVPVATG